MTANAMQPATELVDEIEKAIGPAAMKKAAAEWREGRKPFLVILGRALWHEILETAGIWPFVSVAQPAERRAALLRAAAAREEHREKHGWGP